MRLFRPSTRAARIHVALGLLLVAGLPGLARAAHPYDDDWLASRMAKDPAAFRLALDPALAAEYRVQILVAFPKPGAGKTTTLERHGFRVDAEYFYPASAVKTCGAVASMLRYQALRAEGHKVTLATPITFNKCLPGERTQSADPDGPYTLGRLTRQMSIVSNNESFNRLYELAGQEALNTAMHTAGLTNTLFIHRLNRILSSEANRRTPRIDLAIPGKKPLTLPEATNPTPLRNPDLPGLDIGTAYIEPGTNTRVDTPMSFAEKNRQTLVDLQNMLAMIVRPDIQLTPPAGGPPLAGFPLDKTNREFLQTAMLQRPGESKDPIYPESKYSPTRFKPALPGLLRIAPLSRWQVYNKAGKAYGFRIENAYVVDVKTKKSFFLTVNVFANPDGVMNDGTYTYDRDADPLIHALAEMIARDQGMGE